jgi:hypothetical protein
VLANTLVPVVSIAHLVVRWLIGITRQARTSSTTRTYPESEGSSMTRSTRVALCGSRGVSIMPLTKLFSGAPHKLLAGFDGDHHQAIQEVATSNSNKHHRLTIDHLVPLDATSRCNHTRIALSHNRMITIKYM